MPFRSLITLALALVLAAPAAAQDVQPEAEADAVFSLRNVESMAFDPAHAGLFAIADGRLMHWSLFPLELRASLELDTLASDLAISPAGNLFVVGQRWNRESLMLLGGSILAFPIAPGEGIEDWFRLYQVADNAAGISQFSSVAFDASGMAHFGSPVAFSILSVPDDFSDVAPGTERRTFDLRCGASAQLSILEDEGQIYYVSSTIEGAALEFGRLAGPEEKPGHVECFRVANIYAQKTPVTTFFSVRHALIERPPAKEGGPPWRGVLALDPNIGRLYFFEIIIAAGEVLISRALSSEIGLDALDGAPAEGRTGAFGLLAASGDGAEILVSGTSMRRVLRFGVDDDGRLRARGGIELAAPVQGIEISPDGGYAALVTGENRFGAERVLTVLRAPAALPEGAGLPAGFHSVRLLQEELNAAGFDAGRVDGIAGPRTLEAVKAYLAATAERAPDADTDRLRAVIRGVFPRFAAE